MSCMATLATRFARRCSSRSSVERLATSKAAASDAASATGSGSATAGSSIAAACIGISADSSETGSSSQSDLASGGGGTCSTGSGSQLPAPFPRRQRLFRLRARPSHGYRADSGRRRRNSIERKAPQRGPKRLFGREASRAARCSGGWTSRPRRGRRRPGEARRQSAAAERGCHAKPGKRPLRGPAPWIVGVLSSDSLPFSDYGNGFRGCQLAFRKGVPACAEGGLAPGRRGPHRGFGSESDSGYPTNQALRLGARSLGDSICGLRWEVKGRLLGRPGLFQDIVFRRIHFAP